MRIKIVSTIAGLMLLAGILSSCHGPPHVSITTADCTSPTSIQAKITASSATGTSYDVAPGTYAGCWAVTNPPESATFTFATGVTLDGNGLDRAFNDTNDSNAVRILANSDADKKVKILDYDSGGNPIDGAIRVAGAFWQVRGVDVSQIFGAGVKITSEGGGTQVLDSYIHHNGCAGVLDDDAPTVLIQNVNASDNGTADPNNSLCNYDQPRAGIYFTGSGWTVRSNTVSNNNGPGVWALLAHNATINSNTVTNNTKEGIRFDTSDVATIADNIVWVNARLAQGGGGNLRGGQIFIRSSCNANVHDNSAVTDSSGVESKGITIQAENRPVEACTPNTRNNTVQNNSVTCHFWACGGINDNNGDTGAYDGSNMFLGNDYNTGGNCDPDAWFNWKFLRSFPGWQSEGQDTTASGGSCI